MVDQDRLFARLARSTFRSRFRLGGKERQYCLDKGPEIIDRHAADFIRQRLAPAAPINDGKQTPMRGHPVFIAQHATATCCRGCLEKLACHSPRPRAERAGAGLYRAGHPPLAGATNECAVCALICI